MKSKSLLLVISALALVGCGRTSATETDKPADTGNTADTGNGGNTEAIVASYDALRVAYKLSGENLIRAEVAIRNNKAEKVIFNEVQIGAQALATANVTEASDKVFTVAGKYGNSYVSKYLNFNGTVYAGTLAEDGKSVTFANYATTYTTQAELATAYYAVVNNFVYGSNANGDNLGITHQYDKASASSTYWPKSSYAPLGWKGNIAKIEEALEGKNLSTDTLPTMEQTGATITSYQSYLDAAKAAFEGSSKVAVQYGRDMIEGREKNGHSMCVAKVEVAFGADKKVEKVFINETDQFLSLAATLSEEDKTVITGDNVVSFSEKKTTKTSETTVETTTVTDYSKYISVAGKVWTGTAYETKVNKEAIKFSDGTHEDALEYYGSSLALSQEYYNAAFLHQIDKVSADGTVLAEGTRGNGTATKAELGNLYWNRNNDKVIDGSQWKWNIDKLQKGFIGLDFSTELSIVKDDTSLTWKIGTVDTGATMTEGETFFNFVKVAYSYLA